MDFYKQKDYKYYNQPTATKTNRSIKPTPTVPASTPSTSSQPALPASPLSPQSRVVLPPTKTLGGRIKAIAIANLIDKIDEILEHKTDKDIKLFFAYKDDKVKYCYVDFSSKQLEFNFIYPQSIDKIRIYRPFFGFVLHPRFNESEESSLFDILSAPLFERYALNYMEKNDFVFPCITILPLLKEVGLLDKMDGTGSDAKEVGRYISYLGQYVLAMHEVKDNGELQKRTFAKKQNKSKSYIVSIDSQKLPDLPTVSHKADMKANSYLTQVFLDALAMLNGEDPKELTKQATTESILMSQPTFEAYKDFVKSMGKYSKTYSSHQKTFSVSQQTSQTPPQQISQLNKDDLTRKITSLTSRMINDICETWSKEFYPEIGDALYKYFNNEFVKITSKYIIKNIMERYNKHTNIVLTSTAKTNITSVLSYLIKIIHLTVILDILYKIYEIKNKKNIDLFQAINKLFNIAKSTKNENFLYFAVICEIIAAYEDISDPKGKNHLLRLLASEFTVYVENLDKKQGSNNKTFKTDKASISILEKEKCALPIYENSNINIENQNDLDKYLSNKVIEFIVSQIKIDLYVDNNEPLKNTIDELVQCIVGNLSSTLEIYNDIINAENGVSNIQNSYVGVNFYPLSEQDIIDEVQILTLNNKEQIGFSYNIEPTMINACFAVMEHYINNPSKDKKIELSNIDIELDELFNAYDPSKWSSGGSGTGSPTSAPFREYEFASKNIFNTINPTIINNYHDLFHKIKEYENSISAISDSGGVNMDFLNKNSPAIINDLLSNLVLSSSNDIITKHLGSIIGQIITIPKYNKMNEEILIIKIIEKIIQTEILQHKDKKIIVLFHEMDDYSLPRITHLLKDNIKSFGGNKPQVDYMGNQNSQQSSPDVLLISSSQLDNAVQYIKSSSKLDKLVIIGFSDHSNKESKYLWKALYEIYLHYYPQLATYNNVSTNKYAYFYIVDYEAASYNINLMLFYRHLILASDLSIVPTSTTSTLNDKKVRRFNSIYEENFLTAAKPDPQKGIPNKIKGLFSKNTAKYIHASFIDQILSSIDSDYDSSLDKCGNMLPSMSPEQIARASYKTMRDGFTLVNRNASGAINNNPKYATGQHISQLPSYKIIHELLEGIDSESADLWKHQSNYSYIVLKPSSNSQSDEEISKLINLSNQMIERAKSVLLDTINKKMPESIYAPANVLQRDILELIPSFILDNKYKQKNQSTNNRNVNKYKQKSRSTNDITLEVDEKDILAVIFSDYNTYHTKNLSKSDVIAGRTLDQARLLMARFLAVLSHLTGAYDDRLLEILNKMPQSDKEYKHMFMIASKFVSSKLRPIIRRDKIASAYYSEDEFRSIFMALIQDAFADPISHLNECGVAYGININNMLCAIDVFFNRIKSAMPNILNNIKRGDILSQVSRIVNIFLADMMCIIRSENKGDYINIDQFPSLRYNFVFDDPIIAIVTSMIIYGVMTGKIKSGGSKNQFLNVIVERLRYYNITKIFGPSKSSSGDEAQQVLEDLFVAGFLPIAVFVSALENENEKDMVNMVAFMLSCLELSASFFELTSTCLEISNTISAKYIVKELNRIISKEDLNGFIFSDTLMNISSEENDIMNTLMKTQIKWDKVDAIDLTKGVYLFGEFFGKNNIVKHIANRGGYFRFVLMDKPHTVDYVLPDIHERSNNRALSNVFLILTRNEEAAKSLAKDIIGANSYINVKTIVSPFISLDEDFYVYGYSDIASDISSPLAATSKKPEKAGGWLTRIVGWNMRDKIALPVAARVEAAKQWIQSKQTIIEETLDELNYGLPAKLRKAVKKAVSKFVPFLAI